MGVSLYDITVPSYLQGLRALGRVMAKGRQHWVDAGRDPAEIPELRLAPDMLPFRYQIEAAVHHSADAVAGVLQGWFAITMPTPDLGLADLERLIGEACDQLAAVTPEALNAREGQDVEFRFRDTRTPYVAEHFLASFSLPNFYFHATTAYDLLRRDGVKLGKRDFLGELRSKPTAT